MRTIEEILREANNRGLRLLALYERWTHPDKPIIPPKFIEWRAAFATPGGHRDEDVGATAAEALEECLARAKNLKGPENRPVATQAPKDEALDLDDLI